jgi:hypothetical protein
VITEFLFPFASASQEADARRPSLVRRALHWLATKLPPPRVIYDREGASPYLSRYYILGRPKMADGSDPQEYGKLRGQLRRGVLFSSEKVGVYLHKFHRGDDDQELHGHPWKWAVSFVLSGGYREERRIPGTDKVTVRLLPAGSVNLIFDDDYHRVDLLDDEAWTLFIVGPKVGSWCFWNRHTGETTPWRTFIQRKRSQPS